MCPCEYKLRESSALPVESQLTHAQGITELENTTITTVADSSVSHQWMLRLVGKSLGRTGWFVSASPRHVLKGKTVEIPGMQHLHSKVMLPARSLTRSGGP